MNSAPVYKIFEDTPPTREEAPVTVGINIEIKKSPLK